jgi:ABC-type multidrug transport system fused ATPase/permease subunit
MDGVDVRQVRPRGVAAVSSLVPQSTFVFDDTVRGNVTLGDDPVGATGGTGEGAAGGPGAAAIHQLDVDRLDVDRIDDDRVWAALELAQADQFVAALPAGLDTRVGERGASLSGGQRQRLALARAVVREPRLLVMDDATSAVDPRVEQAILAGLRDAREGLTVVVVAYRKATISLADEVVYVEHGRVVARGSHAALLEENPRYRHLVNAYEEEAAAR